MILAAEAAALFSQPPYTLEDIEQQIREKAVSQDYTCFDKNRISQEVRVQLHKAGFSVSDATEFIMVRWK